MIRVGQARGRPREFGFDPQTADHTSGCGEPPPDVRTGTVCAGTGDLRSCMLCPHSPTYWRRFPRPPAPPTVPVKATPVDHGRVLDWSDSAHADRGRPKPCRVCGAATILRDTAGLPCHKVCAEAGPAAPVPGRLM